MRARASFFARGGSGMSMIKGRFSIFDSERNVQRGNLQEKVGHGRVWEEKMNLMEP